MVLYLPFEIIENINQYLDTTDKYQLVLVNHAFYKVFVILLYRSITIKTNKQYKQLIHVLEETSLFNPLGKYTKSLKLLLCQLEQEQLERTQQLCPFIQSIHVDGRIWHYLGSDKITKFISVYGSSKLSCLTLDLYHMDTDLIAILCYTHNLRNLTIMGIRQLITIDLIESIHASCIYLNHVSLDGHKAEATISGTRRLSPLHNNVKTFQLKCQFGADRYQDWLPYIGTTYPKLLACHFHHAGKGKDLIAPCSTQVYRQFIQDCPLLQHVGWHNIEPDFRYFQQLDRIKSQQLKQLEIYDSIAAPWLLTTCLFDSAHSILENVRQLTFGAVPRGMTSDELMASIHKACPQLVHLSLVEPKCHLSNPFRVDTILKQCQRLQNLELDHIVLRVSYNLEDNANFPLKRLTMRHCSSFDGVFDYMSPRCPQLEEISLFAHTQKDRRYKVQIHMPHQEFKKVQFHGLRTESYDTERRIRFFSVREKQVQHWHVMDRYDIVNGMERANDLRMLGNVETSVLESVLEKPAAHANWNDIYGAGYVDFVCKSVGKLYLNKKLVTLI